MVQAGFGPNTSLESEKTVGFVMSCLVCFTFVTLLKPLFLVTSYIELIYSHKHFFHHVVMLLTGEEG
jgi:hypothetical protein